MKKTVDYIDLCRYDKELRYAVDVEVLSNDFLLGDKGDQLRFAVSEYGYTRLLSDSLDGLIDIKGSTLMIDAFDYPEITQEDVEELLNQKLEESREQLEDRLEEKKDQLGDYLEEKLEERRAQLAERKEQLEERKEELEEHREMFEETIAGLRESLEEMHSGLEQHSRKMFLRNPGASFKGMDEETRIIKQRIFEAIDDLKSGEYSSKSAK